MTTLYGIKNCDTVKKARTWLDANAVPFNFHDFRQDGLSAAQVESWIAAIGMDTLINKRSTTWKELTPAEQASVTVALIVQHPTLIKRPLVEHQGQVFVGFKESDYRARFL